MSLRSIQRTRATALLVGLLTVVTIVGVVSVIRINGETAWELLFSDKRIDKLYNGIIRDTLLNPWFYSLLAGILLLERILPANRAQKLLSPGFITDFIYYFLDIVADVLVVAVWVAVTRWIYDHTLWFLTIDSIQQWPQWALIVLGYMVIDFNGWFTHWVRHKVPWFWYFHTVHHSQRQMNMFTDTRYHALEYVIAHTITFVPLFALGITSPNIIIIGLVKKWYRRFYHANIRMNLGPLRYILVTPQSHRIHHSKLREHRDMNFGVTFSIWDQLFGTQYCGWDEYPDTGVEDSHFPHEDSYRGAVSAVIQQFIYPFACIRKSLGMHGAREGSRP